MIPVIKEAKKLGYYTITCDYLPENIAHKYSDEYHNVSITDHEAVLALARKLQINGIMSFAVDPGVVSAAYVAEKMGLPGCPLKSVEILQNKGLFRTFLEKHNFTVPKAKTFNTFDEAIKEFNTFNLPVIVKPVDAAGSKGVSKVEELEDLKYAIENALTHSISDTFIIEEFIEAKGSPSDSDCFSINGDLHIVTFSNQYFNSNSNNPFTPSAYSWPSNISRTNKIELKKELQRLVTLLNLQTSIFNIEVREGKDGKAYIMEMAPRGGGNRLSEMVRYATGLNLIEFAVKGAMGEKITVPEEKLYNGNWTELILFSRKEGKFHGLEIDASIEAFLIEKDIWINSRDKVYPFSSANYAIGTLVFNFKESEQVENLIQNRDNLVRVVVS
ncbi:ATP-grasp domain-containing protein [Salegentibacter sediminis]|uniref:ATP-grasp domain-containing protein n=1 Tax=Salegentibacter sediminis TaxID=1930251 RepID=UPI0018E2C6B2|nr:ATP-grasp domain-containing protein [Salegentibacter sediminis]